MKTDNYNQLDQAAKTLRSVLDAITIPDVTLKVLATRNQISAPVFSIKRIAIAAAILLSALNGSVLWYSWNYSQDKNQTELIDSLYSNDADWKTLLTLNE
jgi:hypothetical protein